MSLKLFLNRKNLTDHGLGHFYLLIFLNLYSASRLLTSDLENAFLFLKIFFVLSVFVY